MDIFDELKNFFSNEDNDLKSRREIIDRLRNVMDAIADAKDEKSEDVLVPIKSTIIDIMCKYDVSYGELSIMLLRKYYIALLNLGYIDLEDLSDMVEKFVSKIDKIEYCSIAPTIYGGGVRISDSTMFISTDLTNGMTDESFEQLQLTEDEDKELFDEYDIDFDDEMDIDEDIDADEARFEIEFYKAVTSVIIDSYESKIKGFSYIVCEMIAQKVWFLDEMNSPIVIPKTMTEMLNDTIITTRTGYLRCNLPISLFKQFCIAYEINENKLFKRMFYSSFKETLDESCNGEMKVFLFMLDKHFDMYAMRTIKNDPIESELSLIEAFQIQLGKKLNKSNSGYFAFFSLLTTNELTTKIEEYLCNSDDEVQD